MHALSRPKPGFVLVLIPLLALSLGACAGAPPPGGSPPRPEAPPPPPSSVQVERKMMAPAPSQAPVASIAGGPAAPKDTTAPGAVGSGEEYGPIVENAFTKAAEERLSTFAADVDTASYANTRRFLREGKRPPRDAVRLEELINYFDYGWKEPSGGAPIAATTELGASPWRSGAALLAIGLRTRSVSSDNLPPANLVFLVDTSGSMSDPDKLPLVKRAFTLLVETLRPRDAVAIVAYAGSAGLVLPPTTGAEKGKILEALERLSSGGSTAGGAGITLAYETALANLRKGGNNRVVLATDGDFNVGPSSQEALDKLIVSYGNKGVFLSVMGFGAGNLKDSRMESLADKGNGNYSYVDSVAEARRVLVEEMGATLLTAAKDVKLQVEFDPAVVDSWRLVGYENRLLAAEDFADDAKDAGEMGAGHRVTALYEIIPAAGARPDAVLGSLRVRYKRPDGDQSSLLEFALPAAADAARPRESTSADFRFAAAVAAYGLLLRGSEHSGSADWPLVLALARGAAGDSDRRREFLALAEAASRLK